MKTILVLFIVLILSSAKAGIYSQIDEIVRDTIEINYSDSFKELGMKMQYEDIWSLEIQDEMKTDTCILVVTALANKPALDQKLVHEIAVCIFVEDDDTYSGKLIYDRKK